MRRLAPALALLALLAAGPTRAELLIAYAPETNLERLDTELLGRAQRSVDLAAYVLTDVPVIDALAADGARGVRVRIYREAGGFPPRGAVAEALARLAAAPNVEVRFKPPGPLMHLKSYAVDGRVLRGGAANFSASGLKRQNNDRWQTDEPAAVAAFERTFDVAWGP